MSESTITPPATADEAVAIAAAIEALWPRPVVVDVLRRDPNRAWRFSGRWWQRDRFAHAERPWR